LAVQLGEGFVDRGFTGFEIDGGNGRGLRFIELAHKSVEVLSAKLSRRLSLGADGRAAASKVAGLLRFAQDEKSGKFRIKDGRVRIKIGNSG
jgi:hypothetical protein